MLFFLHIPKIVHIKCAARVTSLPCYLYKSSHWWEHVVLRRFTERDWLENVRISRDTFYFLCGKLRPVIAWQNTRFRRCICVEKRLAITLWCLATCAEYRTIGQLFGVARCTVCVIVHNTCAAIVTVLQSDFFKFPEDDELRKVLEGFEEKWQMPQAAGAIDGCHLALALARPTSIS